MITMFSILEPIPMISFLMMVIFWSRMVKNHTYVAGERPMF